MQSVYLSSPPTALPATRFRLQLAPAKSPPSPTFNFQSIADNLGHRPYVPGLCCRSEPPIKTKTKQRMRLRLASATVDLCIS